MDLFGETETTKSLVDEQIKLKKAVRNYYSQDVRDFGGSIASEERAKKLTGTGQLIDVEGNKERVKSAKRIVDIFDTLYDGELYDKFKGAAVRLDKGENFDTLVKELQDEVEKAVKKHFGGKDGKSDKRTESGRTDTGTEEVGNGTGEGTDSEAETGRSGEGDEGEGKEGKTVRLLIPIFDTGHLLHFDKEQADRLKADGIPFTVSKDGGRLIVQKKDNVVVDELDDNNKENYFLDNIKRAIAQHEASTKNKFEFDVAEMDDEAQKKLSQVFGRNIDKKISLTESGDSHAINRHPDIVRDEIPMIPKNYDVLVKSVTKRNNIATYNFIKIVNGYNLVTETKYQNGKLTLKSLYKVTPKETEILLNEDDGIVNKDKYEIKILIDRRAENNKSGSNDPIHSDHPLGDSVTSGAGVEPDKDIISSNEDENNGRKGEESKEVKSKKITQNVVNKIYKEIFEDNKKITIGNGWTLSKTKSDDGVSLLKIIGTEQNIITNRTAIKYQCDYAMNALICVMGKKEVIGRLLREYGLGKDDGEKSADKNDETDYLSEYTNDQIYTDIFENDKRFTLNNGWKLEKRTDKGQEFLIVTGDEDDKIKEKDSYPYGVDYADNQLIIPKITAEFFIKNIRKQYRLIKVEKISRKTEDKKPVVNTDKKDKTEYSGYFGEIQEAIDDLERDGEGEKVGVTWIQKRFKVGYGEAAKIWKAFMEDTGYEPEDDTDVDKAEDTEDKSDKDDKDESDKDKIEPGDKVSWVNKGVKKYGYVDHETITLTKEPGYVVIEDKTRITSLVNAKNITLIEKVKKESKPEAKRDPLKVIADYVTLQLATGQYPDTKEITEEAKKPYAFGTSLSEGKYNEKHLYDAVEMGINQYILLHVKPALDAGGEEARKIMEQLDELDRKIKVVQSKRTEKQQKLQQFSTPSPYSYLVAWLANISNTDTVLEPSAGTGSLAIYGKLAGARTIVNEIDTEERDGRKLGRNHMLKLMGFNTIHNFDGEQINNLLPDDDRPTVVLANPPFSSSGDRGIKSSQNGFRHITQALKTLQDGGRLVAILGESAEWGSNVAKDFWKETRANYTVRAVVKIDGKVYDRRGTSYPTVLIVIDNIKPAEQTTPLTGSFKTLAEAAEKLEGIKNGRKQIRESKQTPSKPTGSSDAEEDGSGGEPEGDTQPPTDTGSLPGSGGDKSGNGGSGSSSSKASGSRSGGGNGSSSGNRKAGGNSALSTDKSKGSDTGDDGGSSSGGDRGDKIVSGMGERGEIQLEESEEENRVTEKTFDGYVPTAKFTGGKEHPGELVESAV